MVGPIDQLQECPGQKAIIAIGDCSKRRELAETYNCQWMVVDYKQFELGQVCLAADSFSLFLPIGFDFLFNLVC